MKSILEYLNEYFKYLNEFEEIKNEVDSEMISEAFQSSILREINSYLEKNRKEDEEKAKTEKCYYRKTPKFKNIFYAGYKGIRWDQITDDMAKEYSKDDSEGIKLAKRICSNRSNSFPGMIILISNDEKSESKYPGVIIHTGWDTYYYSLVSSYYKYIGRSERIKPSEVEDLLTKKFYIIDLSKLLSDDIIIKRRQEKEGMVLQGDPDYYKKIASVNYDRYKRYADKIKAEKDANDGIPEKVNEYMKKVMDLVTDFSTDPTRYIKYEHIEYDIQDLLSWTSDKKTWNHGKNGGYISGKDGLLTVFAVYMKSKLSLVKGNHYSSSWDKDNYDTAKQELEEIFKKIDQKIANIEAKIAA